MSERSVPPGEGYPLSASAEALLVIVGIRNNWTNSLGPLASERSVPPGEGYPLSASAEALLVIVGIRNN